jgi:hypothetical protein
MARGHRDVVTVVGHGATIAAGERITASGEWINDRTNGQQFKARFLWTSPPTSADRIVKYLSSGMIRGIGPAYAKKLVRAFGEKVLDVIEATPDRLRGRGTNFPWLTELLGRRHCQLRSGMRLGAFAITHHMIPWTCSRPGACSGLKYCLYESGSFELQTVQVECL